MSYSEGNILPVPKGMPEIRKAKDSSQSLITAALHCTQPPSSRSPPSSVVALNSKIQSTWVLPRATSFSRSHLKQNPIFSKQGKKSLQSSCRKMIPSAWGFQGDVLLQPFTNWLYLKLPWGLGAGKKAAWEKTFAGMSEETTQTSQGSKLT